MSKILDPDKDTDRYEEINSLVRGGLQTLGLSSQSVDTTMRQMRKISLAVSSVSQGKNPDAVIGEPNQLDRIVGDIESNVDEMLDKLDNKE